MQHNLRAMPRALRVGLMVREAVGTMTHEVQRLPCEPSSPAVARRRLAAFLARHRASEAAVDDALIVLSEMIANAVSHGDPAGDGTIEVAWAIKDGKLELSVLDAGQAPQLSPLAFDEDSLGGRGLSIISRLAERWWVDATAGTRVNAELALTAR